MFPIDEQNVKSSFNKQEQPKYKNISEVLVYDQSKAKDTKPYINVWVKKEDQTHTSEINITVFDVAAYIVKKLGTMTAMKLQKLVYYCQAWSLVWDEKPLFNEPIEAWANGPVIRELFNYHRGKFSISSIPKGNPNILNEQQKETIDTVLGYYGDKSAQWLIELSHSEEPWKETRGFMAPLERGHKVIPLEVIANYYSSLRSEE